MSIDNTSTSMNDEMKGCLIQLKEKIAHSPTSYLD